MSGNQRQQKTIAESYCFYRNCVCAATVLMYIAVIIVTCFELSFIDQVKVDGGKLNEMYPGMTILLWQNRIAGISSTDLVDDKKHPDWYKNCPKWDKDDEQCTDTDDFSLSAVTGTEKTLQFLTDYKTAKNTLILKDYSIFAYYKTSLTYTEQLDAAYKTLTPAGKCNIGENSDAQMACGDVILDANMVDRPDTCNKCWNLQKDKKLDLDLCVHTFQERRTALVAYLVGQFLVIILCAGLWVISFQVFNKKGWTNADSKSYGPVPVQEIGGMARQEGHPFLDFYHLAIFIFGAYVLGFSIRVFELLQEPNPYYDCTEGGIFKGIKSAHGVFFPILHAIIGILVGLVAPFLELIRVYMAATKSPPQNSTQKPTNQNTTNPEQQQAHSEHYLKAEIAHIPGEKAYMGFRV